VAGCGGLWRHADFLRLWAGQTVSMVGSRVTYLALPLTAILTLHATAFQMGILEAIASAPALLCGIPIGVLVDRVRRWPLLIASDLGRAALLISIPGAAWLGALRLAQLYVVAFLVAALGVLFSVAYRSYLPSLVRRDALVEGNSKLGMSASLAQLSGPGVGGFLVQLLTAPGAIVVDAISFAVSAMSLGAIRASEPSAGLRAPLDLTSEVAEGLRALLSDPRLRTLAGTSAIFILFDSVLFAVYVLFMTRALHLGPATIGLIFGLAGSGGLLGATVAGPLTSRIGIGRTMLLGIGLAAAGEISIASAGGSPTIASLMLVVAEGIVEFGAGLYAINARSLQAAIAPERLRGRVNAATEMVTFGMAPVGALLGGALGATIGLRGAVLVAGLGTVLSFLWLLRSPARRAGEEAVDGA